MNQIVTNRSLLEAGEADPAAGARLEARLVGEVRPDLLRDEVLADIFSTTARQRGYRIALVSGSRVWTYAQVDAEADAVARGLIRAGIRPGDVVGLWMARGPELLIAQIAVAKSGAAWLPFDADAPVERIATCLGDAGASGLLTSEAFAPRAEATGRTVWTPAELVDPTDDRPVNPRARGLTADHPAYLIYTSGSTGTPKGIVVSQRNICHFLRAANAVYGLVPEDVVFQGASVAFDLSMEEIWVPYLVGATLFVATPEMMGDTDRLPDLLAEAGVTVLDTVPTLLAMLARDVPSLRVIILGGEACPPSVAARWSRPGRRIFNSYGPTEATVVATVAEVRPGEAVTIGRPLPNYTAYVVDDALELLPPGVQGELLIGGPGVAQGYLGRPELTAEKFIVNPFTSDAGDPILYRSGDAVSLDQAGNIVFHGRIDDQVKIRGFRVELGEIEAKLADFPGVSQAAVVLRQDDGLDRLVAFLVPDPGRSIDRLGLRMSLRDKLPSYMVPAHFEVVDSLPRLVSGKVDRKVLKAAVLTVAERTEMQDEPRTPTEAALLAAAQGVFPGQALPLEADFFTELGGHSLLAARFVSAVRENPALAGITLQDVYAARSLRAMAARLDERAPAEGLPPQNLEFEPPPLLRRFLCGLAQAAALPVILGLMTAQWLGVFVSYMIISGEGAGFLVELATLLAVYMAINVITVAVAIAGKWLVIGRTRPGRYPLWGVYYYRWWLAQRLTSLTHLKWFQGSPIMRVYLRALGAKVGADALVAEVESGAIDLVSIGRGASIGGKVKLANAEVVGNELIIGEITIGDDAYVGTSCVIGHDVVIGEGAELGDLTAIAAETRVGAWEKWDGSPGRRVGTVPKDELPAPADASRGRKALNAFVYILALLILPPVSLLPIFPAFYLFDQLDTLIGGLTRLGYTTYLPLVAWPTAMALVAVTVLLVAALRWLVLPRVREGVYSVHSGFYLRKWIVALATEVTLDTLSSLYATVYMRGWYRLMGARIGKDAEISCNLAGRYDLTEIGEKCFIADEVVLGDEDVRRGWMTLKAVKTEARVFVGNDAVVPPGSHIPTGSLIGIKSKPPANTLMSAGDTWFGSPPIKLPVRQRFDGIGANWTFEPSRWRRLGRAVFEAFNLSLPTMLFITFGTLAVEVLAPSIIGGEWWTLLPLFLAASVVISCAMALVVIGVKWTLMGVYRPTMKPMWSWWALRTEAVAVMYWGLAGKVLLDHLRGSPMLPWVLRLFGCRFGKGVFMDTTDITEFDCVKVGDFCAVNALSALQTHLYEDRVMKVGRVTVGDGVTIGAGSTVLYDTFVGDFARLGPLTLVMKGECIPAHGEWHGAPAERAPAAEARAVVHFLQNAA
ncbi:amino acid adenylation domain-containing protein [Chelatococcus sp. SYSU_G07232]|uniref:Amino acid adenylation domain-containing protein n=1 Tax=Chelatococcus albus TaxID=3047466 RepID=A0ABT7AED7_9HYPH|nr:Pls/PosA family non-ribosomal peptide synthetase [Chelatococcus sp. SYSU_G07232]MDJ1157742.1 amino acid adenylation domain-containing protein [Chelatococcus sp. SYSU_G07232]